MMSSAVLLLLAAATMTMSARALGGGATAVAALATLSAATRRRTWGSDEGRWRWWWSSVIPRSNVVNVSFLEEELGTGFLENGERLAHLQVGHHGPELFVETMKEHEDERVVADRSAEVTERCGHRLKTAAKLVDQRRSLLGRAKLGGEE